MRSLLILLASYLMVPVAAAAEPFDIPAGDAAQTLHDYCAQSGLNVLYRTDEVRAHLTRPISGDHDPLIALEMMLDGTDLVAIPVGAESVTIVKREARASRFALRSREGRTETDLANSNELSAPSSISFQDMLYDRALIGSGPAEDVDLSKDDRRLAENSSISPEKRELPGNAAHDTRERRATRTERAVYQNR